MTSTGLAITIIGCYFFIYFIVGTIIKNNSIVDMGWGLGFVITIWIINLFYPAQFMGQYFVLIFITIWGCRLTYHIVNRNFGKPEDFRYANWRKEWGPWVLPRAFVQIYMLQGVMMLAILYPHIWVLDTLSSKNTIAPLIGAIIWGIGFFFEVVGDRQLRSFVAKPENKGHLMTSGLWKYTRHPNYFGEATMWWGLYIISIDFLPFYVGILSPIVITYLLRFVSGVPMLERKYKDRDDFKVYASKTNAFIPWFPRR